MRIKFILVCLLGLIVFSAKGAFCQYHFFDGNDWMKLDTYGLSQSDESMVKKIFLKSIFGASIFNNAPLLLESTQPSEFGGYANMVDKFYSEQNNRSFPLYFSLRMAGMQKSGVSAQEILNFQQAIIAKLTQEGLWQ